MNGQTCMPVLQKMLRKKVLQSWQRNSVKCAIEKAHEERYRTLLSNVENKKVFEKDVETMWECRVCGHLVTDKKAPEVCPVCSYSKSYFEVRKENY